MRTDFPADCEKTQAPPTPFDLEQRLQKEHPEKYYGTAACNERLRTDAEILAELFRYHPPTDETLPKFAAINQAAKNFAEVVLQNCPRGNDRSGAIQCIRTARMVANASIGLNGLSL